MTEDSCQSRKHNDRKEMSSSEWKMKAIQRREENELLICLRAVRWGVLFFLISFH
jgi:hypothetical protein